VVVDLSHQSQSKEAKMKINDIGNTKKSRIIISAVGWVVVVILAVFAGLSFAAWQSSNTELAEAQFEIAGLEGTVRAQEAALTDYEVFTLVRDVAAELDTRYGSELSANFNRTSSGPDYDPGMVLGRLEIPSIGVDETLYQGRTTSVRGDPVLALGPNHLPETALPMSQGLVRYGSNCVIGGHHSLDTAPFARLMEVKQDDEIIITITVSPYQAYAVHYTVVETGDISPYDLDTFEQGRDRLYIGTCHGSYNVIFVVTAEMTGFDLIDTTQ
jgi:LPXTG-site transpeptidase (sortase) family protein